MILDQNRKNYYQNFFEDNSGLKFQTNEMVLMHWFINLEIIFLSVFEYLNRFIKGPLNPQWS